MVLECVVAGALWLYAFRQAMLANSTDGFGVMAWCHIGICLAALTGATTIIVYSQVLKGV